MATLAHSLLQEGVEVTQCKTGGGFSLLCSYHEEGFASL